jgi:hypothetical protein
MAGKALKTLVELAAKGKGKPMRKEIDTQLKAYLVAKRLAEANDAAPPPPASILKDMTNEERLAALDQAGWDTSRALWFASKRRPGRSDYPYIEPSPELAFMKDNNDSATMRLLLGADNMTPEELAGNYVYNRLMKPPREGYNAGATKREYEEIKARLGERYASDLMFDAELPAVYPVFTKKGAPAAFDSGWSTQRSIEDLISVYGLPGEKGYFGGGSIGRLTKKYFGDDDLPAKLQGTQIIKEPGGNWLAGSVERAVKPMKRDEDLVRIARENGVPLSEERLTEADAMNTWLDKKLAKYIKNEMATERDPIRLRAEAFQQEKADLLAAKDAQIAKAVADMERARTQRGFTPEMMTASQARIRDLRKERALIEAQSGLHVDPTQLPFRNRQVHLGGEQFPTVARSPQALQWERASDFAVSPTKAGAYLGTTDDWVPVTVGSNNALENNPWLAKVPPETPVYSLTEAGRLSEDLGFSHLVDELSNALNPESGLPANLLIDPDKLGKLNIADAVRRVDEINAWRSVQKAEADRVRANNAATQLFKEYPDDPRGMRWVELKPSELVPEGSVTFDRQGYYGGGVGPVSKADAERHAKNAILADALKYEGEVMQHCVGGYCPDVIEGRSRIFSLRDAEGRPYTTIEMQPVPASPFAGYDRAYDLVETIRAQADPTELKAFAERSQDILGARMTADEYLDDWAATAGRHIDPDRAQEMGNELIQLIAPKSAERILAKQAASAANPMYDIVQIKGPSNKAPDPEYLPFVQDFVRSGTWGDVQDLQNAGLIQIYPEGSFGKRGSAEYGGVAPGFYTQKELDEAMARATGEEPGFAAGGLVGLTQKYNKGGKVKRNALSIVDFLKANGMDSSRTNRKALYERVFGGKYSGTAAQNLALLRHLKAEMEAPAPAPAPAAVAQPAPTPEPEAEEEEVVMAEPDYNAGSNFAYRQFSADTLGEQPFQYTPADPTSLSHWYNPMTDRLTDWQREAPDAVGTEPPLRIPQAPAGFAFSEGGQQLADFVSGLKPGPNSFKRVRDAVTKWRSSRPEADELYAMADHISKWASNPQPKGFAKGGMVKRHEQVARYAQGGIIDFDAGRIDQMAQQLASEIYG